MGADGKKLGGFKVVDRLAEDWQQWADGILSCPVCGALIHPSYQEIHANSHSFADRYSITKEFV